MIDDVAMTSPPRRPDSEKPKEFAPVYLREWLNVLGVKPRELVRAGVINEGYLSQLRSGKRVNPSPSKLIAIGKHLKITWTDLYKPPPSVQTIETIEKYDQETLDRLMAGRKR